MPTKDSGAGNGGRRPTGSTGRNRNAFCSFCRKSYRDVGPLVEGPGNLLFSGAPKGRHKIAQGAALGIRNRRLGEALKGRNKRGIVSRFIAPFQGSNQPAVSVPRALPWAFIFRPFGAPETCAPFAAPEKEKAAGAPCFGTPAACFMVNPFR
jgi:ClpX C4-type zinc finger